MGEILGSRLGFHAAVEAKILDLNSWMTADINCSFFIDDILSFCCGPSMGHPGEIVVKPHAQIVKLVGLINMPTTVF